jgi:uncharacterized protein (TIGR00288 family)
MQHFTMAPHRGSSGAPTTPGGSPNAALLIDFDNVTMGIRSDLTRQLKELLNSDIIKGKVAVQRAYADWRRYAQYIVPLSEASVDLIFAPAYGSSKKNATDIRLAIDALELVFTRPEIGTYILLSGDSDFSSLVLKLKEYGKYVIGVGLRESASDLLVQNCDEYFSYSSLTGLTRAGDEGVVPSVDAWDLVERAINQMAADDDVMRSDRLKQVMVELDPTFDEGVLGFTKFNKFLTEAASRNRLALKKLENGQYEVQPFEHGGAQSREERPHGRGRRDRKEEPRRESREQRESRGSREPRERAQADPAAPSRGRGEPRAERPRQEAAPSPQPRRETAKPAARPVARDRREEQIGEAYELLRRVVRELSSQPGEAVRDSDIKRKMLEIEPGWDESSIGFTKFSRFLRQAHDADVVDLSRHADGFFEARLSRSPGRTEAPRKDRDRGRDRDRDRERDRDNGREGRSRGRGREERAAEAPTVEAPTVEAPTVETQSVEAGATEAEADAAIAGATQATEPAGTSRAQPRDRGSRGRDERRTPAAAEAASATTEESEGPGAQAQPPVESADTPAEAGTQATAPAAKAPAAKPAGFGRRGRRGGAADGPPPLLPGQVVGGADGAPTGRSAAAEQDEADVSGTDIPAEPAPEPEVEAIRATGSVGATPAEPDAGHVDAPADVPSDVAAEEPAEQPAVRQEAPVAREAAGPSVIDSEALGLPTDRGAVIRYLSNSYQGVGQKTAESLIDAFGADRVFQGLNDEPDRVREILGAGRRTDALLNAWQRDLRRRSTGGMGGTADPSGDAPSGA